MWHRRLGPTMTPAWVAIAFIPASQITLRPAETFRAELSALSGAFQGFWATKRMHRVLASVAQPRLHLKLFTSTPVNVSALCIVRSLAIRGLCKQHAPSGQTRPKLHQSYGRGIG